MTKKTIIRSIIVLLMLTGFLAAEIDQIRFGSKGDPLNGLTMTWRGNYSNCRIKWGYSPDLEKGEKDIVGRAAFGSNFFTLFDFTFPQLLPCETVYYAFQEYNGKYEECQCVVNWTKTRTFKTAQTTATKQFSFIAGGDSRGESQHMETWGWVAGKLAETNADFYLFVGDLALRGGEKRMWENWFAEGKDFVSKKLIYHCIGNHETYGDPLCRNFVEQLVMPDNGDYTERYYSFEYGNAVFITLNTEFDLDTDRGKYFMDLQTQWLEGQLKKYRGKKNSPSYKEWVIITFHRPFFTIDKHMGEMTGRQLVKHEKTVQYPDFSKKWWLDLFDKYKVDVIINGHTHAYMRAKPIRLRKTGPGGKNLIFHNGFPQKPAKTIEEYGNKKNQGRMQIVTGGYGAPILTCSQLPFKDQWFVDTYKQKYHYCQFTINGKELTFQMKQVCDNKVLDEATITH